MSDAAGHLPERSQPLLLHHRMLALPQIVIRLLQGAVEFGFPLGSRANRIDFLVFQFLHDPVVFFLEEFPAEERADSGF